MTSTGRRAVATIAAAASVMIVAQWTLSDHTGSGQGGIDDVELIGIKDPEELQVFRSVLNDASVQELVLTTAHPLPLWSITSRLVPTEAGESCLAPDVGDSGQKYLLSLDFAARSRTTRRVYRVEYSACKIDTTSYDVRLHSARFASGGEPTVSALPVVSGRSSYTILRNAFSDPVVTDELELYLGGVELSFTLRYDAERSTVEGLDWFHLLVKEGGNESVVATFEVLYDDAADTVEFTHLD